MGFEEGGGVRGGGNLSFNPRRMAIESSTVGSETRTDWEGEERSVNNEISKEEKKKKRKK